MAEAITKNVGQVWWNAANAPWVLHREPFRVAPHVYYVGNTWVGAYLLDGGDELALIDTTTFEDYYQVVEGVWEMGFDVRRIKKILLSHCHVDHVGGVNQQKRISSAETWLSAADAEFMNHPANRGTDSMFKNPEFPVDHLYDDGSFIPVGQLKVRTRLSPGHTPGTTSFFIEDQDEEGNTLIVAMHGGVGTNTMDDGYFEKNGLDKNLRRQFIDGCEAMKAIHVDISLPSHPAHGDLFQRISADPMDYKPLVDESEWARFLEIRKQFALDLEK